MLVRYVVGFFFFFVYARVRVTSVCMDGWITSSCLTRPQSARWLVLSNVIIKALLRRLLRGRGEIEPGPDAALGVKLVEIKPKE